MNTITKIREIKKSGAFDSANWIGSDLKKLNLIYGWNGSGKTTISRLFSFLERKKIHLPDLSEIEFNILTGNGSVKQSDLLSHTVEVKVFNEDFIADNLSFNESKAKKIVILGKENIQLQQEIITLETEQEAKRQEQTALLALRNKIPKLENILTDVGREVTKQFGNTPLANNEYYVRNYNRSNVEALLKDGTVTESNVSSLAITQTQFDTCRDTIKNEKQTVSTAFPDLINFSGLFTAANDLLKVELVVADLQELKDDVELREWTGAGFHLHKDRDAESCLFCHKPLDEGFLQRLGSFFTDELEKVRGRLDDTIEQLTALSIKQNQENLDSGKLFPDLADEYLTTKSEIDADLKIVKSAIGTITDQLKQKRKTLHDHRLKFPHTDYPSQAVMRINQGLQTVRGLLKKHNDRVEKRAEDIDAAAQAIERHTIASVLMSKDYFRLKKEADDLDTKIQGTKTRIGDLEQEVRTKRASLQNAQMAVDKINEFLKEFFGDQQIYLEFSVGADNEVGYLLKRRGADAKYLSEGEKSVLALSYFFIKLEEEGCNKTNSIVVVDDPVDSQDGVFLFRTFGLLKRQLANAGQMILLTHNFEFFNLMRDWLTNKSVVANAGLYLISIFKSGTDRVLTIEDLPLLLRDYKSEYQYLFCRIYQYAKDIKPLDAPFVANIGRKVLEYFSAFKWSCKTTEQFTSIVLSRFVADPNYLKKGTGDFVVKFLNEYSHGQDFSRPVSAPMLESKAIAENILLFIKMADKEHYDDLEKICT